MKDASSSFENFSEREGDRALFARWLFSRSAIEQWPGMAGMEFVCGLCGEVSRMPGADPERPLDLREGMTCSRCGVNARLRSSLSVLETLVNGKERIYITEQATPTFAWVQARYPHARGSEFEPDGKRRAAMAEYLQILGGHGPVEFEDVTRLSMADASLDLVASFDVLEHVPDYRSALREFARVLHPGGHLLATFPFTDAPDTVVRATISDAGKVVHHLEPEYHGDPLGGAVLCFQHFGWDILGVARASGFSDAWMLMPWAPDRGILYGNWMFLAKR